MPCDLGNASRREASSCRNNQYPELNHHGASSAHQQLITATDPAGMKLPSYTSSCMSRWTALGYKERRSERGLISTPCPRTSGRKRQLTEWDWWMPPQTFRQHRIEVWQILQIGMARKSIPNDSVQLFASFGLNLGIVAHCQSKYGYSSSHLQRRTQWSVVGIVGGQRALLIRSQLMMRIKRPLQLACQRRDKPVYRSNLPTSKQRRGCP